MNGFGDKVSFIWSVADLLRGPYKPAQYGRVILPLTVLRRLDCVLEPTKAAVLAKHAGLQGGQLANIEPVLNHTAKQAFHNTSKLDFPKLTDDPANIVPNLQHYIASFSSRAREIIEYFGFEAEIEKLEQADRLYLVVKKFAEIDLHPDAVSNVEMGYVFEELVRKFSEAANETAGDHFTPREVIRLMVNLLFEPDGEALTKPGIVRTLCDPACGTGGMLSVAEDYLRELNPQARLECYGQEYNPESYAICGSDLMMKGQNLDNIKSGDSFTADGLAGQRFDYLLANPPFGVEWKPQERFIRDEADSLGFDGRFGAGLPRINDGSFLFLQHMIAKMKPEGSRLAIVFNGSPLFTGDAGSGESNIRRWIIENDWLEAVVALPDQLFYNTGISTYFWIVTNRKRPERQGRVQLINATGFSKKMRKSLGNKRNELSDVHIAEITRIYGAFAEGEHCKIFTNEDFGYRKITVERPLKLSFAVNEERLERLQAEKAWQKVKKPEAVVAMLGGMPGETWAERPAFEAALKSAAQAAGLKLDAPLKKAVLTALSERDETASVCLDAKNHAEPDPELRDTENVPLGEDVGEYVAREVLPYVPDAWVDEAKTKVGYEINFNRHFYKYVPPRPLAEIEADIRALETEIVQMLGEITGSGAEKER
ncbi:MAG: SAM-dependent DNA methyltransferase [Actinobacteria bacterium]|nr:SAM-dependent DNA methyltransferase [Actinomycetota bacterium]